MTFWSQNASVSSFHHPTSMQNCVLKTTQVIVSKPKCWKSLVCVTLTFDFFRPERNRYLPLTILHLCIIKSNTSAVSILANHSRVWYDVTNTGTSRGGTRNVPSYYMRLRLVCLDPTLGLDYFLVLVKNFKEKYVETILFQRHVSPLMLREAMCFAFRRHNGAIGSARQKKKEPFVRWNLLFSDLREIFSCISGRIHNAVFP